MIRHGENSSESWKTLPWKKFRDLTYWSEHNSKLYDNLTSKALKRQNHKCGHCGLKMLSDEKVHLHHIDGNHKNGKPKNLLAIHESCHDYTHMSKRES